MSAMISIYVASDITEADEVQGLLAEAGIPSQLEPAETDGGPSAVGDGPCRVLVAEHLRDDAQAVLQAEAAEVDGEQW